MPGLHATLSASGAKRWMSCPPSARLEERLHGIFGGKTTPFAEEGTKAHSLAELKLTHEKFKLGEKDGINDFNYNLQRKALGEIPQEMDTATDYYAEIIIEKFLTAKKSCKDAKLLLEQRLDFSEYVPKGFGTGDAVIISDELLEVCDLKYGNIARGLEFSFEVHIRLISRADELMLCFFLVLPLARRALASHELVTLPLLSAQRLTERVLLEVVYPTNRRISNGEYLGDSLVGDNTGSFKAVSEYPHRLLCAGVAYRSCGTELAVVAGLELALALPCQLCGGLELCLCPTRQLLNGQHLLCYAVEPRLNDGVADIGEVVEHTVLMQCAESVAPCLRIILCKDGNSLEKLVGKQAFEAIFEPLVIQNEGALTLVPEDDKRVEFTSAEADFSDMTN